MSSSSAMLSSATCTLSAASSLVALHPFYPCKSSSSRYQIFLRGSHFPSLASVACFNFGTFFDRPLRCPSDIAFETSIISSASVKTAAAVVSSDMMNSPDVVDKQLGKRKYHFVVANAKFMLDEEEHFKELLFERLRNYEERCKERDFWLVIEPKLLDKFPDITRKLCRPAVALVSTNGPWITFMKLRLDRVLYGSYEAESVEESLASNPADLAFQKPQSWVAPYPKYEYGWWEALLPPNTEI